MRACVGVCGCVCVCVCACAYLITYFGVINNLSVSQASLDRVIIHNKSQCNQAEDDEHFSNFYFSTLRLIVSTLIIN